MYRTTGWRAAAPLREHPVTMRHAARVSRYTRRPMNASILESERLTLRELTAGDAPFILELTNDPDWLRYIGDRGIRSVDDARDYIANGPAAMYAAHGHGLYGVARKGSETLIGMCGLLRRAWLEETDIGFAFLPAHRGSGYAHEAAAATLDHARRILGLPRVLAIVSPENAASIRLLEKLGMRFERRATPPGDSKEVLVYASVD
jgi:ribosomal-protein-alanine N-acetyltransferase